LKRNTKVRDIDEIDDTGIVGDISMSELIKWFQKRRELKALELLQRHLAATMSAVEDLEKAVKASVALNEKEAKAAIARVTSSEREADVLRRAVMTELARGELPPSDREDLMSLMKQVDMVADWCREATRILAATPMNYVPIKFREAAISMVEGSKECAIALRKSINRMTDKPEEALQAADEVERLEEKVDDLFEDSRQLLAKEEKLSIGAAILMNDLFEAIENVADRCEDACDQVRVITVRR
jgi:predicted phosphate transport protein (TIGR00153 family)